MNHIRKHELSEKVQISETVLITILITILKKSVLTFSKKKARFFIKTSFFLAGDEGIEPSITVLETAVIPFN